MNQSKNILMVYPKIPQDTYWSFNHILPLIGKKAAMPPLGLITVAAMLPEYYNTRIIDMNIESLKDKDIIWADAVFTSSMIVQKESLEEVIQRAKSFNKPIVAGGPYPTQYFDQIKGVDHFVLGEAESGVLEAFLRDFENNKAKKVYARHVIRNKNGRKEIDQQFLDNLLRHFEKQDADIQVVNERPSMNLSPIPRFDLLNLNAYASMSIQQSRGCPHNCDFCNEGTLFGHSPRLKAGEKIAAELKKLYNLGFKGSIFVVDDNFIGNRKAVKEVLPKIEEFQKTHGYPFALFTEADITLSTDEELMAMMRDAGFSMAFVGLESPDKEVLRSMGKYQNIKINLSEAIRKMQSYGIEVTAGFIVGNDNDPDDVCDKIFDFCQNQGIVTAMIGLLISVKGSELYERLKREGRLRKDSEGNNTHNFELNFESLPGKDEKKIISDYKNLLARLYDSNGKNYFERTSVLLDRLGPHPKSARSTGYTELKAFAKSFVKQSCSSYRTNYLRFMKHILRHHRSIFPTAVHQAVYAEHFIKITNYSLKADKIKEDFVEKSKYYQTQLTTSLETGLTKSGNFIRQKQRDFNQFLIETKKRIKKLPEEYRNILMAKYKDTVEGIEALFKRNLAYSR
ncbi:B12-binding domain-containing radical SAM protein [Candidatus Woesearchaeota archaeon]|nr:B12-binding domain-containing radical SAM protein [Candidatus Woesearchaeota archaeon]